MKKILFAMGAAALLLGSCIKDKGNYTYTSIEAPTVALEANYPIPFGENFKLAPEITWSGDLSKAVIRYGFTPISGSSNDVPYYVAAKADGSIDERLELQPGDYQVRMEIRVPDDSGINANVDNAGMVYYFPFTVTLGATAFNSGTMILVNDGGQAKMHFITAAGEMLTDVYASVNGEPLPGEPLQMIFQRSFAGGTENGWVVFTKNAGKLDGAILDPNNLTRDRKMTDNFGSTPTNWENPGTALVSESFMGPNLASWCYFTLPLGGKLYFTPVGLMAFHPQDYFKFGPAYLGDYNFTHLALSYTGGGTYSGFPWCYAWDAKAKRLRFFQVGAGGFQPCSPDPTPQVGGEWDYANVGLDIITMQSYVSGGTIIAKDGGQVYRLWWNIASTPPAATFSNMTKVAFSGASLLKENTKWLVNREFGDMFFSSGNKVYYYNAELNSAPEVLVGNFEGDVTMLKFKAYQDMVGAKSFNSVVPDFKTLMVGTEGHLYEVDFNGTTGSRGTIKTDTPITGAPVDIHRRLPSL